MTLVSVSEDGSANFWGYGRISPAYFKHKCYLKLLVTDVGFRRIPVTDSLLIDGQGLFSKKMTIELINRRSIVTEFTADDTNEELFKLLREKKPKMITERPPQVPLKDRFKDEATCSYLKSAFKISEDQIEEAEDEAMTLYGMNRQLMENYMAYKNLKIIQYLVVADAEGGVHIYGLSDLLASKCLGVSEASKDKFSSHAGFKRESLNVTLEVQTRLTGDINYYIPHTLEANNCIRMKHWVAHHGRIVSIRTIPHVKLDLLTPGDQSSPLERTAMSNASISMGRPTSTMI